MEGFVETMPLNAGPLYFFDQENPEGPKQAKVNTAASCEKYEFRLAGPSEPPSLQAPVQPQAVQTTHAELPV